MTPQRCNDFAHDSIYDCCCHRYPVMNCRHLVPTLVDTPPRHYIHVVSTLVVFVLHNLIGH